MKKAVIFVKRMKWMIMVPVVLFSFGLAQAQENVIIWPARYSQAKFQLPPNLK